MKLFATIFCICSLQMTAQKFSFVSNYFTINSHAFSIVTDSSIQDSLYSYKMITGAIGEKFKKKKEGPQSDYYIANSRNGIMLYIGPYHWLRNRNPMVLAIEIDFATFRDSVFIFGFSFSREL